MQDGLAHIIRGSRPMPNSYFLVLELVTCALFAACLWHAWRRGPHAAWQMLAGVMFGVMLELAPAQQRFVIPI